MRCRPHGGRADTQAFAMLNVVPGFLRKPERGENAVVCVVDHGQDQLWHIGDDHIGQQTARASRWEIPDDHGLGIGLTETYAQELAP